MVNGEIGELAAALRGSRVAEEFADVIAWLLIMNVVDIDLNAALQADTVVDALCPGFAYAPIQRSLKHNRLHVNCSTLSVPHSALLLAGSCRAVNADESSSEIRLVFRGITESDHGLASAILGLTMSQHLKRVMAMVQKYCTSR